MSGMVAALYVDPSGPYADMEGVDPWTELHDATRYRGPWPVVAHPPCAAWGGLRKWYGGARDKRPELAIRAVEQVLEFGGVLEHPANSRLWDHFGIHKPTKRDR